MLKIVIEKLNKGIKLDITGKKISKEEIAIILLKSLFEYCKASDIDLSDLLEELSDELSKD